MSFRLSFHLALLGLSGPQWLDNPPDLSCQDSTRQHAVDDSRLSCKQQSGVRVLYVRRASGGYESACSG
jgi:hypothetical protein